MHFSACLQIVQLLLCLSDKFAQNSSVFCQNSFLGSDLGFYWCHVTKRLCRIKFSTQIFLYLPSQLIDTPLHTSYQLNHIRVMHLNWWKDILLGSWLSFSKYVNICLDLFKLLGELILSKLHFVGNLDGVHCIQTNSSVTPSLSK